MVNMPRRDNTIANSRNRCSYECRSWIVMRIDLPLATYPVSQRPFGLANVRFCPIHFLSFVFADDA